jgi:HD-GYP domain-containing protein (c-di-GMP phosphodiesterase class II)
VTDRPYRKGLPPDEAMRIVCEESGSHLYSPAVSALERVFLDPEQAARVTAMYAEMMNKDLPQALIAT